MPRHAADLEEALNKKGGLTLSQLANYDDLITDALVDRVYYWSNIRKLKANYHACRGVREDLVCKILQDEAIIEKDPIEAHDKILKLPGITKFYKGLGSEDEKEHFERHLRKYINLYVPDCPFEVCTTNRYTITTAEACIKARKTIKRGEAIKYLSGIQVEMTEKEEKELSSRTDFSIVLSSRRKRPSLFLGPARFANHDCDSNARLNTTGPHGIHIVARKDIAPGDEITVEYGEDYFGVDNCECLCGTCESLQRNGWDPLGPVLPESSDEEDEEEDDEEEQPVRRPQRRPKVEDESRTPSVLGKRKRGRPAQSQHEQGEPEPSPDRSYYSEDGPLRAEDELRNTLRPGSALPQKPQANTSAHRRPRKVDPKKASRLDPAECKSYPHTYEWTRPNNGESDDVLMRIFNLLASVGAKRLSDLDSAAKCTPQQKLVRSGMPVSSWEIRGDKVLVSLPDPLPSEVVSSGSERDSPQPKVDSSKLTPGTKRSSLESQKSRLPTITKQRSSTSLRKVVNVEDSEADTYSIPASPAPPTSLPKRGRGRPRKYPRPEEQIDLSIPTDSSSPSPPRDSSSQSSLSSLTSIESFAAGNIATSICNMLTEDETASKSNDQETRITEEDETETAQAPRGRRSLRRSPRKPATEPLTAPIESIEERSPSANGSSSEEKRGPPRTPGDYTLCKALLATPYHRWIECRNCDEFFVQGDAYLTRIACPRCERHSKLYGYHWPKTDKEGKGDREERVLDHRTIHRFIEPDEERFERKGRKTLAEVVKEREGSGRVGSEEASSNGEGSGSGVERRLRGSPRRRLRMTM